MDTLLHRYSEKIKGVIEGFDRIVFKGILKPLCFAAGMQSFLGRCGVLNKEYKDWALQQSSAIIRDAEIYTMAQCGTDIRYLPSHNIRKEAQAHERQKEAGITQGLIGTWSCLESCNTYKAAFDGKSGFPQIRHESSRCKHLYFYYDHEYFGFMSIRLMTWAPYEVQIALNGRQWLKRLLDREGAGYILEGNKFLHVEDYPSAQKLLDSQLDTRWVELLNGFLADVFPSMPGLLGEKLSYTWTLWQSEWAKDYIFDSPGSLNLHMEPLLRHAFLTGTSERILRYMGHPVRADGQPYASSNPELLSWTNQWYDGARIRHWVDKNSLKFYNEQNVLRFEFTMNDPTRYRIYRTVTGSESKEKQLLPMRKGVADITVRTQVSSARIKSFTEQVATIGEEACVGDLVTAVSKPVKKDSKRHRGLEVTGKDLELLRAIADPKYYVDAITNKRLQEALCGTDWANGMTGKRLSGRISRNLRLLREHGLIKKLPKQHKYMLTDKGRLLTTALNQFLGAKVSDLAHLAA
jgi:hypothetical protein